MSDEIPSTLTKQQQIEIDLRLHHWEETKRVNGSIRLQDIQLIMALHKEVIFLRSLINDLSQDGHLEIYNRGKQVGKEEVFNKITETHPSQLNRIKK